MGSDRVLLEEDERSREIDRTPYGDTELEVKLKGPKVTDDEYRERVEVTKLAPGSTSLHGWKLVSLPPDADKIQSVIDALEEAKAHVEE